MSSSEDKPEISPEELYQQSFSDHTQLHTHLPEEAVISLAREVIRRLARQFTETKPAAENIEALAKALVSKDNKAAARMVDQFLSDGAEVDTIYLELLGMAAQRLGQWWESDELTFAEVTVGIGRIYAIIRTLRNRIVLDTVPNQKSAIFASIPQDDHTLGVKMAADLAREDGWEVDLMLDKDHDTLVDAIASSGQTLVGLSGAGEHSLPHLTRLVLALRISAPRSLILVSGNVIATSEEAVRLMHVDGMERTFEGAMAGLGRLWTTLGNNRLQ